MVHALYFNKAVWKEGGLVSYNAKKFQMDTLQL